MTEKAFRLDFLIAIAALLVSAISAIALIYQTRLAADQYAAAIWPYITSDSTSGPSEISLRIINNGLGPALLQSAQLIVDGKPVAGWDDYLHALTQDRETRAFFVRLSARVLAGKPPDGSITTASIGPGTTIRPGDAMPLLNIDLPGAPIVVMHAHTVGLKLCYCSLNKSCWTLDTSKQGAAGTKEVSGCNTSFSIAPALLRSPSELRRKRSL
ncbi:MAG TPA: hypothetical protein VMA98_07390 [Candidatus Acidoferrales bacterium]|nr:hypothetical protein [Candidatus Acidoferrales bacterium]